MWLYQRYRFVSHVQWGFADCQHVCWDPKDGELCLSRAVDHTAATTLSATVATVTTALRSPLSPLLSPTTVTTAAITTLALLSALRWVLLPLLHYSRRYGHHCSLITTLAATPLRSPLSPLLSPLHCDHYLAAAVTTVLRSLLLPLLTTALRSPLSPLLHCDHHSCGTVTTALRSPLSPLLPSLSRYHLNRFKKISHRLRIFNVQYLFLPSDRNGALVDPVVIENVFFLRSDLWWDP
jgi:hypothetical protein